MGGYMRSKKNLYNLLIILSCFLLCACSKNVETNINSESDQTKTESVVNADTNIDTSDSTELDSDKAQETTKPEEQDSEDMLEDISFSKLAGFYDESFELTLKAKDNASIYYTLDGSDPRTSETAISYTEPIKIYDNTNEPNVCSQITDITLKEYNPPSFNIDKGIHVRATAKYQDNSFSQVFTNSYFVGKDASYYYDMKVISMVTDSSLLFDPEEGFYMLGKTYYDWFNSPSFEEYSPGDTRNKTNYNLDGRSSEFPVNIQVFEEGKAVYNLDLGARIAGNSSRSNPQKAFRLYPRAEYADSKIRYPLIDDLLDSEGELISKYDKITLRCGGNGYILRYRDALIHDLCADSGIDYMASEPCILFLNGEFWGFYLLREKPDDYYIESHYGIDKKEVSIVKNGESEAGDKSVVQEYKSFCEWVSNADMTVPENYQKFLDTFDLQSFLDYIAIETYVCNGDWATGYMNNWMVWRSETMDPNLERADGKWRFILYDLDYSSGIYGNSNLIHTYDCLGNIGFPYSVFNHPAMLESLCKNQEFLDAFYNNYIRVVDTYFAYDKVETTLNSYVAEYKEAQFASNLRFGNEWMNEQYDKEVQNLLKFYKNRPGFAKKYLEDYCKKYTSE